MISILDKSLNVLEVLSLKGDYSKNTPYFDDLYTQDLTTGAETYEFTVEADSLKAQHLSVANYIAFKENDEYKLFNIISIEEKHENTFEKTVYCEMAGIELINQVVRPMIVNGANVRSFLNNILSYTEWKVGKVDITLDTIADFNISESKSVYELIQEHVCGTFGAEIKFRVEISNNAVIGKYIDIYQQRGSNNGYRFEYSSNIESVTRKIDTSNLVTALIGEGKDKLNFSSVETADKPGGQDFIADESAYMQWNLKGNHLMGVFKCDTESPHELLRLTREELKKRCVPQAIYEVKTSYIDNNIKIGDTVNIVDHEFNPPLYLTARVTQLKKSNSDPDSNECVLSNFVEIKSNITDEMRKLATQLEGYVDSQFPISGDKIQDNAISGDKIQDTYTSQVIADAVYASLVETEELIADKATIGDLTATNA
ncbi:MAG: phage tail protein, partial [Peptostreptococcaceae bacterium]|nr:phage tail protein [Peptostreptococcaceae bacterium]